MPDCFASLAVTPTLSLWGRFFALSLVTARS